MRHHRNAPVSRAQARTLAAVLRRHGYAVRLGKRRNPARRTKVSPSAAGGRLAKWRWHHNPHSGGSVDGPAASELEQYLVNDGDLYRGQVKSIIANLARKKRKGVYRADLAAKLWAYAVESAAKKYVRAYASGTPWHAMFNKATRDHVARELVSYYDDEVNEEAGMKSNPRVAFRAGRKRVAFKATGKRKAKALRRGKTIYIKASRKVKGHKRHISASAYRKMVARGRRLARMQSLRQRLKNLAKARRALAARRRRR